MKLSLNHIHISESFNSSFPEHSKGKTQKQVYLIISSCGEVIECCSKSCTSRFPRFFILWFITPRTRPCYRVLKRFTTLWLRIWIWRRRLFSNLKGRGEGRIRNGHNNRESAHFTAYTNTEKNFSLPVNHSPHMLTGICFHPILPIWDSTFI